VPMAKGHASKLVKDLGDDGSNDCWYVGPYFDVCNNPCIKMSAVGEENVTINVARAVLGMFEE